MKSTLEREIERFLGGTTKNAEFLSRYIGARAQSKRSPAEQSNLEFWGISSPRQRACSKGFFSISELNDRDQWPHWLTVWENSKIFDVKSVASLWLCSPLRKSLRNLNWKQVVGMTPEIDNWAHSDMLSAAMAELLEERPGLLKEFKRWNRSRNPWLRRQSVVGIYCYARMRKKFVPAITALGLVRSLLDDEHFYVQRGVGWTLREVDRVDRIVQRSFVRKNLYNISATAWFATSELYPLALRKRLVQLRKRHRQIEKDKDE